MPRVDPQSIIADWEFASQGELLEKPGYVLAAERQLERERELEGQHWIDWAPEELQKFAEVAGQQRLELTAEDEHANVRQAIADYLERVVMPSRADPATERIVAKLRNARRTGTFMYNRATGRFITIVDDKAGLPRLCPDDARDEGLRLQRRYLPTLSAWRNNGKALHWAVFTTPNAPRGELRAEMVRIVKRFVKLFRRGRRFPQIKGALVTLEAPLGVGRDWNVHLNVLLMCDGWLEYADVKRAWHWDVEIDRVRPDPDRRESYEEAIQRTLQELIKYPVQAMPTKSAEKKAKRRRRPRYAGDDLEREPPPAMLEWTEPEWSEWWDSHSRFRRTRTYGELYAIPEPEPESLEGFESVGHFWHDAGRLRMRVPLLDSITGDNSPGVSILERVRALRRKLLGPPDLLARVCDARRMIEKLYGRISLATE